MKEHPIIFNDEQVRAVLDGRKTQTRRVVKHIPMLGSPFAWCAAAAAGEPGWRYIVGDYRRFCPYGVPGDRLWVRETWDVFAFPKEVPSIARKADSTAIPIIGSVGWNLQRSDNAHRWRSPIFMPRWASRITLEITEVRLQRLQEISEEDAIAEGARLYYDDPNRADRRCPCYRDGYHTLWDSIYANDYPWESNPWVWVIEFRRVTP